MALLTPELLRRLEQFQLLAARRSKSSAKGERRSKARGQSVEFADFRNYVAGDDFRYLDWNLYGRLDKLFLKLYEEERELPVRIFLDASESMTLRRRRRSLISRGRSRRRSDTSLCADLTASPCIFSRIWIPPRPRTDAAALSAELAARGGLRSVRGRKSSLQFFQNLSQGHSARRGGFERRTAARRACRRGRRAWRWC